MTNVKIKTQIIKSSPICIKILQHKVSMGIVAGLRINCNKNLQYKFINVKFVLQIIDIICFKPPKKQDRFHLKLLLYFDFLEIN